MVSLLPKKVYFQFWPPGQRVLSHEQTTSQMTELSWKDVINALSLANMVLGLFSIFCSFSRKPHCASWMLLVSFLLDMAIGTMTRHLNICHKLVHYYGYCEFYKVCVGTLKPLEEYVVAWKICVMPPSQKTSGDADKFYLAPLGGTAKLPCPLLLWTDVVLSEGYDAGWIQLVCRSMGWFPMPWTEWRDAEGRVLLSLSEVHSLDETGLFQTAVSSRIRDSTLGNVYCTVRNEVLDQEKTTTMVIGEKLLYEQVMEVENLLEDHAKEKGRLHKALKKLRSELKLKRAAANAGWRRARLHFVVVTLDPDTAHPKLILSEDRRCVRLGNKKRPVPDNPRRFDFVVSVLGSESFTTGCHYWEVYVGEKTKWILGVCSESVSRKGKVTASPANGHWLVRQSRRNEYEALTSPQTSFRLKESPKCVGIFLDYEAGIISFYNVTDKSHIFTFTHSFSRPLRPFFEPCLHDEGRNTAPLIICTELQKSEESVVTKQEEKSQANGDMTLKGSEMGSEKEQSPEGHMPEEGEGGKPWRADGSEDSQIASGEEHGQASLSKVLQGTHPKMPWQKVTARAGDPRNPIAFKGPEVDEKPFICVQCGKTFNNTSSLRTHQRIHTGEKPYKCSECGKSFSRSSNRIRHERLHLEAKHYQCAKCQVSFRRRSDLTAHQQDHLVQRPHRCDICGKSFSQSATLAVHHRTHLEPAPYICCECGKSFSSSSSFGVHHRIHTGERPYECTECGRTFSDISNFGAHQRTHRGEKPYRCTQCGRHFSRSSNLIRHQKTHLAEQDEKDSS
ncbi:hypothetical protein STEG23_035244 [Scotinomys teguina]